MALPKSNEAEVVTEETTAEAAAEVETQQEDVLDQAEPPEPETSTQTEVATTAGQSPAPVAAAGGAIVNQLAESGFSGLDIDWTSFPTIVLDGSDFCTGDGNPLKEKEIHTRLMQSRKRYVLRSNAPDDDDAELAYSYDVSADLANPDSIVSQKVRQWKEEEGLDYSIKEYIEAVGVVEDANHSLDGQMVILQIPPTSKGRFSGFVTSNKMTGKGEPPSYLTRVHVGEKVTKAKKPFYPWSFEYVG